MNSSLIRVLLVEDNEDDYVITRDMLADAQEPRFELEWVSTYEAALAAVALRQHDVYLLDYRLGHHNGLEILQKALDQGCEAPFIVITGAPSSTRELDLEAMQMGAADFLSKQEISYGMLERTLRYTLRQHHLYQEMRRKAQQEQALNRVLHAIRQSLNLTDILNTAVTEVQQLLQSDRALIFQLDAEWGSGKIVAEATSAEATSILGKTVQDPCVAAWSTPYQQGHSSAIEDIYTSTIQPCHLELLARFQVRANLAIPILQGERLWGLLIAHECSATRSWKPWEVELLIQLATQLAIAIQQSELFQQVQQCNCDLEHQVNLRTLQLQTAYDFEATLKRIIDKVRDSLDEDRIMQTAVQELTQAIGATGCNAALYDLDQNTSTIYYEHTTLPCQYQGRVSQISTYPELYQSLLQGQSLQFCSLFPNPERGRMAILAFPISDEQTVLGDLWLINQSDSTFGEQELWLVQQVANQCAIGLRQARLYQAAQTQVKELERLNQLKDDFLSTVSHELRTPMSNIKLAIHMLRVNLKQMGVLEDEPTSIQRYVQILQDQCQQEIRLINDLLDFNHLGNETNSLNLTELDLASYIPYLLTPFEERTRAQQQELVMHIAPDLPSLTIDILHFERVLTELLHNACKYTPLGEKITVTVKMGQTQNRSMRGQDGSLPEPLHLSSLQISVTNTGVEILEQERNRIFDKFYRIPNNNPWKHSGTGLGLALVKKLTERLGGTVQVESAGGQTTFTLAFPMASTQVLNSKSA